MVLMRADTFSGDRQRNNAYMAFGLQQLTLTMDSLEQVIVLNTTADDLLDITYESYLNDVFEDKKGKVKNM